MLRKLFRLLAYTTALGALALIATGLGIWFHLTPQLPTTESLNTVRFQVPLRVFSIDGKLIAEFGEKRRVPLKISQVPQPIIDALIATEDEHFFSHPGVDWRGLTRAAWYLAKTGEKGPGGSTITMQVARNFFLGREKTYLRKLNEILLSLQIERELSKESILELYLNKIFLGHRAYGVGAAALVYYGKPLEELTLAQQATIAGLPQRPSEYNPIANPKRAEQRRNHVLKRMHTVGYIDDEAYQNALMQPISTSLHRPKVELEAPYVAEMVRAYMKQRYGGKIYTEGYRVITTIDSTLQHAATDATTNALIAYDVRHGYRGPELQLSPSAELPEAERLQQVLNIPSFGGLRAALVTEVLDKEVRIFIPHLGEAIINWDGLKWARRFITEDRLGNRPKTAPEIVSPGDIIRVRPKDETWVLAQIPKVEGALISLRPDDGAILALTGGFDFYRSKFNRAIQAKRQPGSNFKPFVYSAALEAGFTAATLINDAPVVFDTPSLETTWRPENYSGKFFGPTRFRQALIKSRNLVSIRILREIGIEHALKHVRRFGLNDEKLPRNLSLALGSGSLTPLEIATGYAVFANGGFAVEPYFIDRIEDRDSNALAIATPTVVCRRCVDIPQDETFTAQPINITNLKDAPLSDTHPPARIAPRVISEPNVWIMNTILRDVIRAGTATKAKALGRRDIAGKTGTTNNQQDAWFSGFTPAVVTTTWVGFDTLTPLGRRETGGRAALPMWMEYMGIALKETLDQVQPMPEGVIAHRVDRITGEIIDSKGRNTLVEYFIRHKSTPTTEIARVRANLNKRNKIGRPNRGGLKSPSIHNSATAQGIVGKLF